MRLSISFTSASIISLVRAATIQVDVGLNGLSFTPNTTAAAAGDIVEFHFHPKSHSVVQTSFNAPCNSTSFANPFYSGFVPVTTGEASTVFQLLVNDTKPIWYFCGQNTHCQSGMVGVINGPTTGNTLDVFKTNAAKTSGSTSPGAVSGGILAASSGDGASGDGNSTAGGAGSAGATGSASGRGGATASGKGSGGAATTSGKGSSGGAANTASGTAAGSSTPTGSAGASASSSAGEALRALRWNELLGMGIAVGGTVVLVQ